jgi:FHS family glucose/mannose:H+ symporter-like MFS transporter
MNERIRLTAFASTTMLVLSGVMTGLSATLVGIAGEFGIAPSRAGILYTLHFSGFMAFIVASLSIRGLRRRLILSATAAGVYAVALATAGTASTFTLLAIALVVVGGCGGIVESHTSTLQVMTSADEGEAGRLLSVTQVFFAIGALAAPLYLAAGSRHEPRWRSLFLLLGGIAVAALVIGVFLRTDRFRYVHGENSRLHIGTTTKLSLALMMYVGAEVTLFGWIPTVMEYFRGIPAGRARLAPSVFWLGMLAGRMVTAKLTHYVKPHALLQISGLIAIAATVTVTLAGKEPLIWAALAVASLAYAGIWPLIVGSSGSAGHESATVIAVASGGLGAAIFPYLAGRTAEVLPGSFIPLLAAPLLGVMLLLSNSRRAPLT